MTLNEVINCIAISGIVETIIRNVAGEDEDLKDLSQNIYLDLLRKDERKIVDMFNNQQLNFFIARMCLNNINSVNSPFYTTYKKHKKMTVNIDDIKERI